MKGKGKGKGKGTQRTLGKRNMRDEAPKGPCPNWSRGNGFCKYGPNCRLSHDGPKGGVKKQKPESVFLTTKKGKKARKKLTSLLVKDVKASISSKMNPNVSFVKHDDDEDDDDHLYQLIRGTPTVLILRGEKDEIEKGLTADFVPVRKRKAKADIQSQSKDKRLPYNEIDDAVKVICRQGEHPFIPWNEYTGCCKPGEYDCELGVFIKHHYRDERIDPLPDSINPLPETNFTVTLMMASGDSSSSSSSEEDDSNTDDYSPKRTPSSKAEAKNQNLMTTSSDTKCIGYCKWGTNCDFCFNKNRPKSGKRSGKETKRKSGQSNLFVILIPVNQILVIVI